MKYIFHLIFVILLLNIMYTVHLTLSEHLIDSILVFVGYNILSLYLLDKVFKKE